MTNTFPHTSIKGVTITFVEIRKWEKFDNLDFSDHRNVWMLFFTQPEKVMEVLTPEQRAEFDGLIEAVNAWDLTKHSQNELLMMERKMDRILSHKMVLGQMMDDASSQGNEAVFELGYKVGVKTALQDGIQCGMNRILEAITYVKYRPEVSDIELIHRFQLTASQVRKIRESLNV